MTVNGVNGGEQPLNGQQKPAIEPKVIKNNVEKGSIFKEQIKNDKEQLVREITYWDRNNDGNITSNELYSVSQYIYEDNGITVNRIYDKDNDGMADAKFKTYKYDNQGNKLNTYEDEYAGHTANRLEKYIDYNNNTEQKPEVDTKEQNKTQQKTEVDKKEQDKTEQKTEVDKKEQNETKQQDPPTIVKEGIDKGAIYKEQIFDGEVLNAEFSYKDYNEDGKIDTSEMISATLYNYNTENTTATRYYDNDRDSKSDAKITHYEWDTNNNLTKKTENDEKYKGVSLESLRNAFIDIEEDQE